MAALTGCQLPPSTVRDGACQPMEPYSVDWTVDGDQLTFRPSSGSDYPSLTIEPYRKIA
jgi:hypothetical protein